MSALLWFGGIRMSTKVRDIGWVYVVLVVLVILLAACVRRLVDDIRGGGESDG